MNSEFAEEYDATKNVQDLKNNPHWQQESFQEQWEYLQWRYKKCMNQTNLELQREDNRLRTKHAHIQADLELQMGRVQHFEETNEAITANLRKREQEVKRLQEDKERLTKNFQACEERKEQQDQTIKTQKATINSQKQEMQKIDEMVNEKAIDLVDTLFSRLDPDTRRQVESMLQ